MTEQLYSVYDILNLSGNQYIAIDTNILIQLLDNGHNHHASTKSFFEKARLKKISFIYFLASKFEAQEYLRKRKIADLVTYAMENDVQIGDKHCFDEWYHHRYADINKDNSFITDREIKDLRLTIIDSFENKVKGLKEWESFCRLALGKFNFDKALAHYEISYKSLQDKDLFPEGSSYPKWEDQQALIVKYGLGSADAAILNMAFSCARVSAILTNDRDMTSIFHSHYDQTIACYTFIRHFHENAA